MFVIARTKVGAMDRAGNARTSFATAAEDPVARTAPATEPGGVTGKILTLFDQVFVLNLDTDTERLGRVSDRLNRMDIPFERFASLPVTERDVPAGPHVRPGHIAAARKKGMDDATLAELVEIVALANAGNRLTQGLQVEVDERFKVKP